MFSFFSRCVVEIDGRLTPRRVCGLGIRSYSSTGLATLYLQKRVLVNE